MSKNRLILLACFLGCMLVFVGCEREEQAAQQQDSMDITIQAPIILAEGHTQTADGNYVLVYLEMTQGKYFQALPGERPYASNFQGTYRFRVAEDKYPYNTLSTQNVDFDNGAELNFNQTFTLEIQDYNADGNPDFTLGQRSIGSTNMLYQIYSIDPSGQVFDLSFSEGNKTFAALADTTSGDSFSIKLETENGKLMISCYDIEHGEVKETAYQWKNNSFHES